MAYTQSDLDSVRAAIVELATGARAIQVTIGNKTITYTQTKIDNLKALCSDIEADLGLVSFRTYAKDGGRG